MISTHHVLRPMAVQQDAEAPTSFELAYLWQRLQGGEWVVCDTFTTAERCYAIVRSEAAPQPLAPRKLELLEKVLLGTPPKVLAMDRQRSLSSITTGVQACLRAMGVVVRASQASVLLSMAARAARRPAGMQPRARLSKLVTEGDDYHVVSALRPDLRFPVELSLAEAAVVRSLVAGNSHAQISGERATSPRTVANQLATAFRKLGVSGRRATIERLLEHSARW